VIVSRAGLRAKRSLGTVTVSFATNDPLNNPLSFTLTGTVGSATITDSDNPGPSFSETGAWAHDVGLGYHNDLDYASAGNGSSTATYAFSGLAGGYYQVSADWDTNTAHATNATYQAYDGGTLVATWTVNQQPTPSGGSTYGGMPF
jgi:hypothetical protein